MALSWKQIVGENAKGSKPTPQKSTELTDEQRKKNYEVIRSRNENFTTSSQSFWELATTDQNLPYFIGGLLVTWTLVLSLFAVAFRMLKRKSLYFRYKRNFKTLHSKCAELIDLYEDNSGLSCKHDVLSSVSAWCKNYKKDVASYDKTDKEYELLATKMLIHISFSLLTSGQYHIYRGALNELTCAPNLLAVYKKCMTCAVEHEEITAEDFSKELDYLHKLISQVG